MVLVMVSMAGPAAAGRGLGKLAHRRLAFAAAAPRPWGASDVSR